ncbi:MAG: ankyrin repeat domain-containing protein [Cyanobacteria bacterium REEB67]|nr:ankyrin repeat domain-containing protein [Cyanobacteria bacterium REEB67]
MRALRIFFLIATVGGVFKINGAEAAKPDNAPIYDGGSPAAAENAIQTSDSSDSPGIKRRLIFNDSQLTLQFCQLLKAGKTEEARKLVADKKNNLSERRNAVVLRSFFLNAIRFHSAELIETLINSGLRPSDQTTRILLLKYALWQRDCAIADQLRANSFETDLYADVALGLADKLKLALKDTAAVRIRDENERTLLHWAALTGRSDLLKMLLEAGASVDDDTTSGDTAEKHYYLSPLEVAVSLGHKNTCKLLLAKGANPNGRPGDIERPLTIAAKLSNGSLVQSLLKAGADVDAKDGDGKLPIELTDSESIKALLRTKQ